MATSTTQAAKQGVKSAASGTREAARNAASHDASAGEVERLRDELDSLSMEPMAPALGGAVNGVEEFGRRVQGAFTKELSTLATIVQDRPLLALGVASATGYLLGRLSHSSTYVYPRRRATTAARGAVTG